MEDALKKFVADNREAFDTENVPDTLWDKIQTEIPPAKKAKRIPIWRRSLMIAASIALVATLGFLFITNNSNSSIDEQITLSDINPVFAEQVSYQEDQIHARFSLLKEELSAYPNLDSTFSTDIRKLKSAYDQLHMQLQEVDNPETILRAMIDNLSFQMRILSDQLSIIQKLKTTNSYESPI